MNHHHTAVTHASRYTNWQIAKATLLIALMIGVAAFALRFFQIILIFLTAIILGIALKPLVSRLRQMGIPKWLGGLLLYMMLAAVLVTTAVYGIPPLIEQSRPVTTVFQDGYGRFLSLIESQNYRIISLILDQLPSEMLTNPEAAVSVDSSEEGGEVMVRTFEGVRNAATALFSFMVTVVLSYYWLLEEEEVKRRFLFAVPQARRETAQELWQLIEEKLGSFLIGQSLLCLSVFGSSLIAYAAIGLPNALVLALFAGLMEAVPNIGPVLGAIPALIIGLTVSPITALWVLVASVLIQQLENNFLFPRIMDRAVGIRPFVSLLALLGFTTLFGVVGAVLSIPIAAIVQILLDYFLLNRDTTNEQIIEGRDKASVLEYEASEIVLDIRQQIRKKKDVATAANDQIEDSIEAIVVDLSNVLKTLSAEEEPA